MHIDFKVRGPVWLEKAAFRRCVLSELIPSSSMPRSANKRLGLERKQRYKLHAAALRVEPRLVSSRTELRYPDAAQRSRLGQGRINLRWKWHKEHSRPMHRLKPQVRHMLTYQDPHRSSQVRQIVLLHKPCQTSLPRIQPLPQIPGF